MVEYLFLLRSETATRRAREMAKKHNKCNENLHRANINHGLLYQLLHQIDKAKIRIKLKDIQEIGWMHPILRFPSVHSASTNHARTSSSY